MRLSLWSVYVGRRARGARRSRTVVIANGRFRGSLAVGKYQRAGRRCAIRASDQSRATPVTGPAAPTVAGLGNYFRSFNISRYGVVCRLSGRDRRLVRPLIRLCNGWRRGLHLDVERIRWRDFNHARSGPAVLNTDVQPDAGSRGVAIGRRFHMAQTNPPEPASSAEGEARRTAREGLIQKILESAENQVAEAEAAPA
jgi:hypothetical protein